MRHAVCCTSADLLTCTLWRAGLAKLDTRVPVGNLESDYMAQRQQTTTCAGRAEQADAMTDNTRELLWRWDVRDTKALGKALRPAATDCRKRLVQVCG